MPEKWKLRVHPLRNSIITQSMVFFIIIFALPMALFYQFLSQASSRQAIADAGAQYKVVLQNVSDTMDEVFYSINILQTQLRADSVLSGSAFSSELIGGKDNYTAYQIIQAISRTLYQAYLSSSYIHSIELYHPYADILFSSQPYATRRIVTQPSEDDISWLSEAAEATSHTWQPETDENGAMYLVSISAPIFRTTPRPNSSAASHCPPTSCQSASGPWRRIRRWACLLKAMLMCWRCRAWRARRALMPLRNCLRDLGAFCQMEAMSIWPSPFNPLIPRCAIFSPRRCLP